MTVYFIRHGQTRGNLERRYIGSTDQPLCPEGREALARVRAPEADRVFVSPMVRCRETADILYPGSAQTVVSGLRETDMGTFEGHTYEELKDDPAYCRWLDTAGEAPPPGGESREEVRRRAVEGFLSAVGSCGEEERVAMVVHGGTVMTLLEALEGSHQFYRWQLPNGGVLRCVWNGEELEVPDAVSG